jgi:hypothetical protein
MSTRYKFFRVNGGLCSFAEVELRSTPSDAWRIDWTPGLEALKKLYGDAVEQGLEAAARAHQALGGTPRVTEILALVHTYVDTQPAAVECATAIAAWREWGHPEEDCQEAFNDGRWRVSFRQPAPTVV